MPDTSTVTLRTTMIMTERHDRIAGAVLTQTWLSPAFPTGGFSYSHALETLVDDGRATSPNAVAEWLTTVLTRGSGWTDGLLCRETWRAVTEDDDVRLLDLVNLANALPGTAEFHLETTAQGTAFLRAVNAGWPSTVPPSLRTAESVAYPVAVGGCCAVATIEEDRTIAAFLSGLSGHLISAACRLVPLGQSDAQRVTATINRRLPDLVDSLLRADFDDLGTCAWTLDLASMSHETLHTRLFRS